MAGMRFIHHLRERLGTQLAVWPFDDLRQCWPGVRLVLVEIFPSYYFYRAGMVPVKQAAAQADFLNEALGFYNSAGVAAQFIAKGQMQMKQTRSLPPPPYVILLNAQARRCLTCRAQ